MISNDKLTTSKAIQGPASWAALVVVDDVGVRQSLRLCLETAGGRVLGVGSAHAALEAIERGSFDIVLLDLWLGADSGLDALPELLRRQPAAGVIVVTAFATFESAVEALKRGAADYLPKPFTPDQVRLAVQRVLDGQRLRRRVSELEQQVESFDADAWFDSESAAFRAFLQLARRAAQSDSAGAGCLPLRLPVIEQRQRQAQSDVHRVQLVSRDDEAVVGVADAQRRIGQRLRKRQPLLGMGCFDGGSEGPQISALLDLGLGLGLGLGFRIGLRFTRPRVDMRGLGNAQKPALETRARRVARGEGLALHAEDRGAVGQRRANQALVAEHLLLEAQHVDLGAIRVDRRAEAGIGAAAGDGEQGRASSARPRFASRRKLTLATTPRMRASPRARSCVDC